MLTPFPVKHSLPETEQSFPSSSNSQTSSAFISGTESIKKILGDRIKDARLTDRLIDSPACVVFDENALTGHMQRILKATGQQFTETKPILELNPTHALVLKLKDTTDAEAKTRWADLLLNQALLAEGEQLENPAEFVRSLNTLIQQLCHIAPH